MGKKKRMKRPLIGRRIVGMRKMSRAELDDLGWYQPCTVLLLDDDSIIIPMQDEEGNDSGTMVHQTPDGKQYYVFAD